MNRNYYYGWQLSEMGYSALTYDHMTDEEQEKRIYVNNLLDPSVHGADCGWYGVCYCVCDINGENRAEFIGMFATMDDTPNDARWICVTAEGKASIAEAVWSSVFS